MNPFIKTNINKKIFSINKCQIRNYIQSYNKISISKNNFLLNNNLIKTNLIKTNKRFFSSDVKIKNKSDTVDTMIILSCVGSIIGGVLGLIIGTYNCTIEAFEFYNENGIMKNPKPYHFHHTRNSNYLNFFLHFITSCCLYNCLVYIPSGVITGFLWPITIPLICFDKFRSKDIEK